VRIRNRFRDFAVENDSCAVDLEGSGVDRDGGAVICGDRGMTKRVPDGGPIVTIQGFTQRFPNLISSAMRFLILSFIWIAITHHAHCDEVEKAMLEAAQKCGYAAIAKDWEAVAACMPPTIVESMGGKDVVIDASKKAYEKMATDGVVIIKSTVSKPVQRKEIKGNIYAVIPQQLTLKVPPGLLHQKSALLGISKSPGTVWHFLAITKASQTELMEMFPDMIGEMVLPKPEDPILERK